MPPLIFSVSRQVVETGPFVVGQTFHLLYTFTWNGGAPAFVAQFKDILPPLLKYENTTVVYTNWIGTDPVTSVTAGDFIFVNGNVIGSTTTALVEVKAVQDGVFLSSEWVSPLVTFTVESNEGNWGEEIISPPNNNFEIQTQVCIAEDSLVQVVDNNWIPIQKLVPGVLLLDQNGQSCRLVELIKMTFPISDFIQIPSEFNFPPLFISAGHPILLEGKEIMPEEHPAALSIRMSTPKSIFTLITEQRQFVNIQGVHVATWSQAAWINFITNDQRGQSQRIAIKT